MDKNRIGSNSETCLHFIHSKFDYYKTILDDDRQLCDNLIASIREQVCPCNDDNDKFHSSIGYDRKEFIEQLDYFEREALKTSEENKTCLFQMFQNLFHLHREFAFDEVVLTEDRIARAFQYRPSLFSNIEKLRLPTQQEKPSVTFAATATPQTSLRNSTSFSNRADIEAFQQRKEFIESNEIDLTKLIRDTYASNTSQPFKFSNVARNQQQQKASALPTKKPVRKSKPCENALLTAASKRFILLYNMNTINILCIYDMQKDETKEVPWIEGLILSLGHVDSNIFYLITSTKIVLYDTIKEVVTKQYFLYDTLYKDLLLLTDDLSYRTPLKLHNQIQSTVYDDYCYYLYTNKEYNQILIKCSLEHFQPEMNLNLTKKYPRVDCFLGLTISSQSLIAFLVLDASRYEIIFCDEMHDYNLIKKLPINDSIDTRKIVSTFLVRFPLSSNRTAKSNSDQQLWFVLDMKSNCIHCLTHGTYLTKISSTNVNAIQSISVYDEKLFLAYNEFAVEIIDLDNYFSSLKV